MVTRPGTSVRTSRWGRRIGTSCWGFEHLPVRRVQSNDWDVSERVECGLDGYSPLHALILSVHGGMLGSHFESVDRVACRLTHPWTQDHGPPPARLNPHERAHGQAKAGPTANPSEVDRSDRNLPSSASRTVRGATEPDSLRSAQERYPSCQQTADPHQRQSNGLDTELISCRRQSTFRQNDTARESADERADQRRQTAARS